MIYALCQRMKGKGKEAYLAKFVETSLLIEDIEAVGRVGEPVPLRDPAEQVHQLESVFDDRRGLRTPGLHGDRVPDPQ